MKKIIYTTCCIAIMIFIYGCKESNDIALNSVDIEQEKQYKSVGKEITDNSALSLEELSEKMQSLSQGDTINTKLKATVNEVCQAKGCWMTFDASDGEEIMVKFKDYGFFVPKDISGREVILEGVAFIDEVSVEDQQHYAMDEGKSQEEIDEITTPKKTYAIVAEGVLIAED